VSIWASEAGPDVPAMTNSSDAANYRGEWEPNRIIDVATARSWHDLIRVAWWNEDGLGGDELLLTPNAARELAAKLLAAAGAP
jgi:hypothetical protein